GGDGVAEGFFAPVGGGGLDALQQDEEGAGLDAAAGRSGRSADEHQHDQHQQAGAVELGQRVGGKAGGTGRYTVEESAQPGDVLGQLEQDGAHHDQHGADADDHLG